MKGRLLFLLTLWATLCVALLSALAPIGPPSSRLTGSAFNPATTGVVLKARAHADPVLERVTEPDGDGRIPVMAVAPICLLPALLLLGARIVSPVKRFALFQSSPEQGRRPSSRKARAPPVLC